VQAAPAWFPGAQAATRRSGRRVLARQWRAAAESSCPAPGRCPHRRTAQGVPTGSLLLRSPARKPVPASTTAPGTPRDFGQSPTAAPGGLTGSSSLACPLSVPGQPSPQASPGPSARTRPCAGPRKVPGQRSESPTRGQHAPGYSAPSSLPHVPAAWPMANAIMGKGCPPKDAPLSHLRTPGTSLASSRARQLWFGWPTLRRANQPRERPSRSTARKAADEDVILVGRQAAKPLDKAPCGRPQSQDGYTHPMPLH
jgi:hypothetical protein